MLRYRNLLILILVLIAGGIYLNRAYAHIYSKFDSMTMPAAEVIQIDPMDTKKYVALGDSLTAGMGASNLENSLPELIVSRFKSKGINYSITNLAVPGAVSSDVVDKQLLPAVEQSASLATVFIGTNDVHNFVSEKVFIDNLQAIVSQLKASGRTNVVVINLPYLGTDSLVLPPYNWYFDFQLGNFNNDINGVCAKEQVQCLDLHAYSQKAFTDKSFYSADEFHPSDKGYQAWANFIADNIKL